jgi:hypothetical protein
MIPKVRLLGDGFFFFYAGDLAIDVKDSPSALRFATEGLGAVPGS